MMEVPALNDLPETPTISAARSWRAIDVALLILVLAIAAWVQWTHVQPNPSFDELWHLMLSTGRGTPVGYFVPDVVHDADTRLTSLAGARSVWHVWTSLDGMPHPPLYFLSLRVWREVFGESDRAAHALSIACSLIGIAFSFMAGRLAMDRWTAALVGLALGCAQTQVYLAQEMRPYALATAIAAAALWLMTRAEIVGPTRKGAIALGALTLPLLLSHYFTLGACVAIGFFGVLRLREQRKVFLLTTVSAGLVFCIAWLPFALRQARDVGPAAGYLKVQHVDVLRELGLFACAPFRLIADREYSVERTTLVSGAIFIVPWFLLRRMRALLPWAITAGAAVSVVFLVDVAAGREHLTVIRYLAVAAPAVVLLFTGTAWAIDRRLAYATGSAVLAAGVIYLASGNIVNGECPDFAGSIAVVERNAQPDDAILCYSGTAPKFYSDMFALTVTHSKSLLPRKLMILTRPVAPEAQATLPHRLWLISGRLDRPTDELVPDTRVLSTRVVDVEVTVTLLETLDSPTALRQGSEPAR